MKQYTENAVQSMIEHACPQDRSKAEALVERYIETRTEEDRNRAVEQYLFLVAKIAGNRADNQNWDNMFQDLAIHLMRIMGKFDPKLGYTFTTFAWKCLNTKANNYWKQQQRYQTRYKTSQDDSIFSERFEQPPTEPTIDPPKNLLEICKRICSDRQYQILIWRMRGITQSEIGKKLGVSREMVRQEEERGLARVANRFRTTPVSIRATMKGHY